MIKLPDLFRFHPRNKEKALSMVELKREIDASGVDFPMELTGTLGNYPERTVITRSVQVGDATIATIFLFCPEEDMAYFKLSSVQSAEALRPPGPVLGQKSRICMPRS